MIFESLRKILSAFFGQLVNFKFKFVIVFLIIQGLWGCGSHIYHFVEPGETLYSISWAYGHDYREVAQWNNIRPPYVVKRGQRLRVAAINNNERVEKSPKKHIKNNVQADSGRAGKGGISSADTKGAENLPPVVSHTTGAKALVWKWPVKGGKIVETFDAGNPARQGVDLKGNFGQPVYSAEAGRVVYSGGGLKHYGKLIIVKHNETFLSAYAHNKRLFVKEGDVLKAGQRIAEMGSTGTNTTKLHFEIRRNGKPVNPLSYLPRR
jgi:lipoprotein NlpD